MVGTLCHKHGECSRCPDAGSSALQAFADVKAYYKDITANNLDLIRQQREELASAQAGETAAAREATRLAAENRRLSAPQDAVRGCSRSCLRDKR